MQQQRSNRFVQFALLLTFVFGTTLQSPNVNAEDTHSTPLSKPVRRVRVSNTTKQTVKIGHVRIFDSNGGEKRLENRHWTIEPGKRSVLLHDGKPISASEIRFRLKNSNGITPTDGKVWVSKYTSGEFLDVRIEEKNLAVKRQANAATAFETYPSFTVALRNDGTLAIIGDPWEAVVYDVTSGKELQRFRFDGDSHDPRLKYPGIHTFRPKSNQLIESATKGYPRLVDCTTGKAVPWKLPPKPLGAERQMDILTMNFASNGRFVAIGEQVTAYVWEIQDDDAWKELWDFDPSDLIRISSNGRYVLSCKRWASGYDELRMYDASKKATDIEEGKTIRKWEMRHRLLEVGFHIDPIVRTKISDFESIVDGDGDFVLLATPEFGIRSTISGDDTTSLWSPWPVAACDGLMRWINHKNLLYTHKNNILWWRSYRTLEEPIRFKGHTHRITSISVIPESTLFLTGSEDGTAILWDRRETKPIRRFHFP